MIQALGAFGYKNSEKKSPSWLLHNQLCTMASIEAPTAVGTRMSQLEDLLKQSMSHTHDALGVLEGWRRHFFEVDTLISDVAKRSAQISNLRTSFSQARDRIDEIQENLDTAKQVGCVVMQGHQPGPTPLPQVERQILAGPAADFAAFLRVFERLDHSIEFVQRHAYVPALAGGTQLHPLHLYRHLVSKETSTADLLKLRDAGLKLALEYYTQLLRQHTSVPNSVLWSEGFDTTITDGVWFLPSKKNRGGRYQHAVSATHRVYQAWS